MKKKLSRNKTTIYILTIGLAISLITVLVITIMLKNDRSNHKPIYLAIGDSITYGADENQKSYVDYMAEDLSDIDCVKACHGGYTVSDVYNNRDELTKSVIKKSDQVEYITIFLGSNDYGFREELSDTRSYLIRLIDYAKTTYPNAEICVVTPLFRDYKGQGNAGDSGQINKAGIALEEYVDTVKQVTEKAGLRIIDLSGSDYLNSDNLDQYTMDGLHPNAAFNQILAKTLEEMIFN